MTTTISTSTSVDVELEIEVECEVCGSTLTAAWKKRYTQTTERLYVDPCEDCLKSKADEVREETIAELSSES